VIIKIVYEINSIRCAYAGIKYLHDLLLLLLLGMPAQFTVPRAETWLPERPKGTFTSKDNYLDHLDHNKRPSTGMPRSTEMEVEHKNATTTHSALTALFC